MGEREMLLVSGWTGVVGDPKRNVISFPQDGRG